MRKSEEDQGAKFVRCVLGILLGGAVALMICFLFLLLASVGISKGWLREEHMYQLTIVACVLGGFSGGMTAVRRCGIRNLVVGVGSGAVFFLLLLTVGLIAYDSMSLEYGGMGLLCGAMCGGAAAGLIGSRRQPKKHRAAGRRHTHGKRD